MEQIMMDIEPISLSTSPMFSIMLYKPQKYKLYSKGNIDIDGSFLFVNNNNKKTQNTDTFFDIETLSVNVNGTTFDINITKLTVENQSPYTCNVMACTNITKSGETLQREFYILSPENITIKIIKCLYKCNNLVEIVNVQKLRVNNTERRNILSKTAPIPIPIQCSLEHRI